MQGNIQGYKTSTEPCNAGSTEKDTEDAKDLQDKLLKKNIYKNLFSTAKQSNAKLMCC